jgi:DNA-binding transcriptional MerR regulator
VVARLTPVTRRRTAVGPFPPLDEKIVDSKYCHVYSDGVNPLDPYRDRDLSLSGLVEAAAALGARLPAVADERVRSEVDERTVRYYQSTGLVDRPARYEGRNAVYGFRHLLQVLATKGLQGAGYRLAQVQAALAGVDSATLEAAVLRALGPEAGAAAPRPHPAEPAPLTPARPALRALVQFEVAPGVWITVDPQLHPDPAALAADVRLTLHRSTP